MRSFLNCCFLLLIFAFFNTSYAQSKDIEEIKKIIQQEEEVWNRGDIEGYVQFYAPGDSARMIYSSGITYGRDSILAFYKKYWPKDKMGHLTLDQSTFEKISDTVYFVTGRFTVLIPDGRKVTGRYSSLMKKINGRWYIYTDHSA
jgi:uncharacterized protein (TIGR02246 family)